MNRVIIAALVVVTAACASAALTRVGPADNERSAWSFSDSAASLRAASCPADVIFTKAAGVTIAAGPVALGDDEDVAEALDGLSFVGGWALTSDEPNFGGLSGLAAFPSGNLLAVSDGGAFVWINLKEGDGFEPETFGSLAYLQDADGRFLRGKTRGDAEGVALRDGLVLVSFERDHRVEAFDLEGCGGAARAALISALNPAAMDFDKPVKDNSGPESITLVGDRALVGVEQPMPGGAAVGFIGAGFSSRLPQARGRRLTGLEHAGDTLYSLHRSYLPGFGNTITIQAHEIDIEGDAPVVAASRTLATLKAPLTVDNFEGVAAHVLPDGRTRLYIVSDDNFSDRQRTLLYAFDLIETE